MNSGFPDDEDLMFFHGHRILRSPGTVFHDIMNNNLTRNGEVQIFKRPENLCSFGGFVADAGFLGKDGAVCEQGFNGIKGAKQVEVESGWGVESSSEFILMKREAIVAGIPV